jgi:hypothetical protein
LAFISKSTRKEVSLNEPDWPLNSDVQQ